MHCQGNFHLCEVDREVLRDFLHLGKEEKVLSKNLHRELNNLLTKRREDLWKLENQSIISEYSQYLPPPPKKMSIKLTIS